MGAAFKSRLDGVRARIERAARRAGRDPGCVTLVAVSKSVPVERLREAATCGCRVFGENRVQEADVKMEALNGYPGLEWHLIGPLQMNKIKAAVGRFALLHAVDRLEVAERLDRAARERGLTQAILLEVNVAGEWSRSRSSAAGTWAKPCWQVSWRKGWRRRRSFGSRTWSPTGLPPYDSAMRSGPATTTVKRRPGRTWSSWRSSPRRWMRFSTVSRTVCPNGRSSCPLRRGFPCRGSQPAWSARASWCG